MKIEYIFRVGHQAKNIGIWFSILEFLAHLAVISNVCSVTQFLKLKHKKEGFHSKYLSLFWQAFLISFTSEFLPKILYQYEHSWSMDGYINFTLAVSPPGASWDNPNSFFPSFFLLNKLNNNFSLVISMNSWWQGRWIKLATTVDTEMKKAICRLIM